MANEHMKRLLAVMASLAMMSLASCSTLHNLASRLGVSDTYRNRAEQEAVTAAHRAAGTASTYYGGVGRAGGNQVQSGSEQDLPVLDVDQVARPESGTDKYVLDPALTGIRRRLLESAMTKIGCKYQYASKGPAVFDCSGFTSYVFGTEGIRLLPGSLSQSIQGREVKNGEPLEPCDLVFFSGRKISRDVGHVGIVISYNEATREFTFIHASSSNGVEIQSSASDYYAKRYIGARRIIEEDGALIPSDPDASIGEIEIPLTQAQPEPAAEPEQVWYKVKSGDTLSKIAQKNHTTVKAICRLNGIKETTILQIGKKLRIK